MARKKSEVNKVRGQNLRKVLAHYGMDQKELAERLHYSKEHISYIINGRRNLTLDIAEKVVDIFPEVRLEWLMGRGGYMNWEEEVASQAEEISKSFEKDMHIENSIKSLVECLGYKIEVKLVGIKAEDGVIYHDGTVESCRITSPERETEEITYKELRQIIYNITAFTKQELAEQFDASWQLLREGNIDG